MVGRQLRQIEAMRNCFVGSGLQLLCAVHISLRSPITNVWL